jgi:hypothetical protein
MESEQARSVFDQSDGKVTTAYYAKMNAKGVLGQLAVALFRAQKRSIAAKTYRRGKWTRAAYDVKNWSLSEICRILSATESKFQWGWQRDPNTPGYEWVLYVELPTGQVSFHSASRITGPLFSGHWDGKGLSKERILKFCDLIDSETLQEYVDTPSELTTAETSELMKQIDLDMS